MDDSSLLTRPHLSVITSRTDDELGRIQDVIENKVLVDGRGDLEELFGRLLALRSGARVPKTLDLIGHSNPGPQLLVLGDWVIDTSRTSVTAFFRELVDNEVFPRLGIHAMRLLGCHTAETDEGRTTICALSDILGIEVYGTRHVIYSAHYDGDGFRDDCMHALVCSSDLRRDVVDPSVAMAGEPYPRMLDIDSLPTTPLAAREHSWPFCIANADAARNILKLVRRSHGAHMPGLLALPNCEIALPSARPNWYHLAQVILDGEFLRVYPDGNQNPGVVFPVDDPRALRALLASLPTG